MENQTRKLKQLEEQNFVCQYICGIFCLFFIRQKLTHYCKHSADELNPFTYQKFNIRVFVRRNFRILILLITTLLLHNGTETNDSNI